MYNQFNYPAYGYGMQPQSQPIQQFQSQTPQATCYFVKSVEELANTRVAPNTYYIGINKDNKELYVRRMNNDGNIELETYHLKSELKEKSELEKISDRLTAIENTLKERKNERLNEYANQQFNQQQTQFNATIPTAQTNI